MNEDNDKAGLCGSDWLPTCKKCQEEVKECCFDVELTLFPDEIKEFKLRDYNNFETYSDDTYGYEKEGKCCFLNEENFCELQLKENPKPIDCLIFPINYKNANIYLDESCWNKDLVSKEEAIDTLIEKLNKYPHYRSIKYEIRETDSFIMEIPVE